jgi:hypothetical protein
MCNRATGYCDGSCQEAREYWAEEERQQESIKECPYKKECIWITVNTKTDKCTTCGKITKY